MIRVATADDLELIRTGFELIVDNEADMTAVAGAAVVVPSLVQSLFAQARNAPKQLPVPDLEDLTGRELEVLKRLAEGMSNAEIAAHHGGLVGPGGPSQVE